MQTYPHEFRPSDLVGGHVVLDLANTVTARNAQPVDWLDTYSRALEWAALTGRFDRRVLAELERLDTADPDAGVLALQRLRDLREAVHDVLAAAVRDEVMPEERLAYVEARWKDAVGAARLTFADGRARLELDEMPSQLDDVTHELALDALDLLRDPPLERMRICAGEKCGWLFVDRSKGGLRRWCDMATCGNAAKSRRHYRRKRAAVEG